MLPALQPADGPPILLEGCSSAPEEFPVALANAAVETVAYSDLFDYPLTAAEIHRYLVSVRASRAAVEEMLDDGRVVPRRLHRVGPYFTLPGRDEIVEIRCRRAIVARELWPRAIYYGRWIARLPFVCMVAVTGALAVDNSDADDDFDYIIVTVPGRLWLCRALVIGLVRLAARRGDTICPNYFLSQRALALTSRTLYTAREIAQMVPLAGFATYDHLRRLNAWVEAFLPNAAGAPRTLGLVDDAAGPVRRLAERALQSRPFDALERWEMRRKIHKLTADRRPDADTAEVCFGPDYCKGHFGGYESKTLEALRLRLAQYNE